MRSNCKVLWGDVTVLEKHETSAVQSFRVELKEQPTEHGGW